ncbi:MAG: hypothetical protein JXR42_00380 [Gammaproteobacteria bacterium]|nr:hypothetical protein [Gammaproteobacteria bacterium]
MAGSASKDVFSRQGLQRLIVIKLWSSSGTGPAQKEFAVTTGGWRVLGEFA